MERYKIALNNQYDGYRLLLDEECNYKYIDLSSIELKSILSNPTYTLSFNNTQIPSETILFLPLGYLPNIYDDPLYPSNTPQSLDSMNNGIDFVDIKLNLNGEFVIYYNLGTIDSIDQIYKLQIKIENNRLVELNDIKLNVPYTEGLVFLELNNNLSSEITIIQEVITLFSSSIMIEAATKANLLPAQIDLDARYDYQLPVTIEPMFEGNMLLASSLLALAYGETSFSSSIDVQRDGILNASIFVNGVIEFPSYASIEYTEVFNDLAANFAIHKLANHVSPFGSSVEILYTEKHNDLYSQIGIHQLTGTQFEAVIDIEPTFIENDLSSKIFIDGNSYIPSELFVIYNYYLPSQIFVNGLLDLNSQIFVTTLYDGLSAVVDCRYDSNSSLNSSITIIRKTSTTFNSSLEVYKYSNYTDFDSQIMVDSVEPLIDSYTLQSSIWIPFTDSQMDSSTQLRNEDISLSGSIEIFRSIPETSGLSSSIEIDYVYSMSYDENIGFAVELNSQIEVLISDNSYMPAILYAGPSYLLSLVTSDAVNGNLYDLQSSVQVYLSSYSDISSSISVIDPFGIDAYATEMGSKDDNYIPCTIEIYNESFEKNYDLNSTVSIGSTTYVDTGILVHYTHTSPFDCSIQIMYDDMSNLPAQIYLVSGINSTPVYSQIFNYINYSLESQISVVNSSYSLLSTEINVIDEDSDRLLSSQAIYLNNIERYTAFNAIKDATVTNITPYTNYGTSSELSSGKYTTNKYEYYNSLMAFDLYSVPTASYYSENPVIHADLVLNIAKINTLNDNVHLNVYMGIGNWSETAVNWSNYTTFINVNATLINTITVPKTAKYVEIDVTSALANWTNREDTQITFLVTTANNEYVSFYSKESLKGPKINVNYYRSLVDGDFFDDLYSVIDPNPANFSDLPIEFAVQELVDDRTGQLSASMSIEYTEKSGLLECQCYIAPEVSMAINNSSDCLISLEQTEKEYLLDSNIELHGTLTSYTCETIFRVEIFTTEKSNSLSAQCLISLDERTSDFSSSAILGSDPNISDCPTNCKILLSQTEKVYVLDSDLTISYESHKYDLNSEIELFITNRSFFIDSTISIEQTEDSAELLSELNIIQESKVYDLQSMISMELRNDSSILNSVIEIELDEKRKKNAINYVFIM